MRTEFLAFTFVFCMGSYSALANPIDNTYTLTTDFAVPELSFHVARLWFLPDWQAGVTGRSQAAPEDSGDLSGLSCETAYNLSSSCSAPQTVKNTYPFGKLTCYECECPAVYKFTSCSSGYELAGEPCSGKYPRCDAVPCPSDYTAGKTCGSGYNQEINGKSGSQDCVRCIAKECPDGYTAGLGNCKEKDHSEGWKYETEGYAGDETCGKCSPVDCAPGYDAGVTQCSNTTNWTYGSNGYSGDKVCGKCSPKSCDPDFTPGLTDCNDKLHPEGWKYESTPSGNSICGKCTAKTVCTAGTTSCKPDQKGMANGFYVGDKECLTCVSACGPTVQPNSTQVCEETCNGNCVKVREMTCKEIVQARYPSAVVVSTDAELWHAAENHNNREIILFENHISLADGSYDVKELDFYDVTLKTLYQVAEENPAIKNKCGSKIPSVDDYTIFAIAGINFDGITGKNINFHSDDFIDVLGGNNCPLCTINTGTILMNGWSFLTDFAIINADILIAKGSDTNEFSGTSLVDIKAAVIKKDSVLDISDLTNSESFYLGSGLGYEYDAGDGQIINEKGASVLLAEGARLNIDNADVKIGATWGYTPGKNSLNTIWISDSTVDFDVLEMALPTEIYIYDSHVNVYEGFYTLGNPVEITIEGTLGKTSALQLGETLGCYPDDRPKCYTDITVNLNRGKIGIGPSQYSWPSGYTHMYLTEGGWTNEEICTNIYNTCTR